MSFEFFIGFANQSLLLLDCSLLKALKPNRTIKLGNLTKPNLYFSKFREYISTHDNVILVVIKIRAFSKSGLNSLEARKVKIC